MSPIYGQLSDKPLLAFAHLYGVPKGNCIDLDQKPNMGAAQYSSSARR